MPLRLPFVLLLISLLFISAAHAAAAPQPLRIGVGGDYPDGLDGLLNDRGLPHERIFPWELADPQVLVKYQVLLLSCPASTRGYLDDALRPWLKAGGRLYIEAWAGMQGAYPLPDLVDVRGTTPLQSDVLLTDADHPVIKGLDHSHSIDTFHLQGTFLHPRQTDGVTVLAQYCPDGGGTALPEGISIFQQQVGQGEIVYSGAPLSFCCFHRGPTTEPLMMSIISYLAQGRALPRLAVVTNNTSAAPGLPAPVAVKPAEDNGTPPPGLQTVEDAAEGAYNVTLKVARASAGRNAATPLLLDAAFGPEHQPRRPLLWLLLDNDRLRVVTGKTSSGAVLSSAIWQPGSAPVELLVRRRAGSVSMALGDRELLRTRTSLPLGGVVAYGSGCIAVSDAGYQPVEPPNFGDDFMRDTGDPSPWTNVSGQWQLIGLGHEKQSVNGFWLSGEGSPVALTTVGESWWEDYTASVAVRLDTASACGLCGLYQPNGDYVGFLADAEGKPGASLRVVSVRGQKERVLVHRDGGVSPGQWYRLGLRLHEGKLEALLDGDIVLKCDLPDARGGAVALLARDGRARFDDVQVGPATEPLLPPRHEGTPTVKMPVNLGPQDSLTWASPAAVWTASPERPSLLWHSGDFGTDLTYALQVEPVAQPATRRLILAPDRSGNDAAWLSVTIVQDPQGKEAAITVTLPGKTPVEKRLPCGADDHLSVVRRGNLATILWNNREIARDGEAAALRCAGLEVEGPAVEVGTVQVQAAEVGDYVFGVAPTDWHVTSGTWEVASRWACDSRWSWFAGWGDGDFSVWNKRPIEGDVAMDYYVGIKMEAPGGAESTRARDLNATLCGDTKNPRSGYSFILGGDGGVTTQLLRNGVVVAENPSLRIPGGYGVHHEWFHVRVARVGSSIEMDLEGRPVFRYTDPQPLPGGYVGLWSHDNGMLVPRVTLYH